MALESLQDNELIEKVLEGDSLAFEHLFMRYRDSIMQLYMQRTSGNSLDCDDLLQETFIKVYLNIHRYDSRFTFGQWVYTIAKNTFIDYVRKKRDDVSELTISTSTQSMLPNPEESIINSQQRAEIFRYMEGMSDRYKKLIELRFLKEYSYEEIAKELNLPLGTVKTQIHRAREILCKSLKLQ
ncbi:MAG: sigma-70 family RNA polymerase sigma factor [Rikenellaceae bacterium]